ncbi:MAG: hypothetical protein ACSHX6_06945 [Akkermansiaceae bacterium]
MRIFVVMLFLCFLGGDLGAQVAEKERKVSLVDLIVGSEGVYRLAEIKGDNLPVWEILAGENGEDYLGWALPAYAFGGENLAPLNQYLDKANKDKKFLPGNLVFYFRGHERYGRAYCYMKDYSADLYLNLAGPAVEDSAILFPRYDGLRDDLIWLCRNRYLLRQLSKGRLIPEIYHFTPHQLEFLVRVCSAELLKELHTYAKSGRDGVQLATLYQFMDYDPADAKRFPLLDEGVVAKLAIAIDDGILERKMFADLKGALGEVKKKIVAKGYLTERDKRLLRSFFINDHETRELQREVAAVMKGEIIARGDINLLKPYLQRIEKRQSIADLTHLAELINSKRFTEGVEEFQELIMAQFDLRKEIEVVWILAPLIRHEEKRLAWRARLIMRGFTGADLGDDPASWRLWYEKMNE